jgi:putative SOS response-associated peptidase YedK
MCGRFVLATPVSELQRAFGFADAPNLPARHNVAPTQDVAVVTATDGGGRALSAMRWGLVPFWAADPSVGARMINARGETVAEKPAFRAAFRQRRCLVPADGFYEWQGAGRAKRPFLIRRKDRAPIAFAGLWEVWRGPKGGPALDPPLRTVAIVTTAANDDLRHLHDRMPVILDAQGQAAWLDPAATVGTVAALVRGAPPGLLDTVAVSTRVNAVRNDDPSLVEPEADDARLL